MSRNWSIGQVQKALLPLSDLHSQDDIKVGHSDFDLNPEARALLNPNKTPAAVLVPLVNRDNHLQVLLTQRTKELRSHAGQISFPGGRVDLQDRSAVDTALRETEEEIGLDRKHVEVLGLLEPYHTITGYWVTPVVAVVEPTFDLKLQETEVAEAFEVPLEFLMNPENVQKRAIHWKGRLSRFYVFPYQRYLIWGATAGMLMNFQRRIRQSR